MSCSAEAEQLNRSDVEGKFSTGHIGGLLLAARKGRDLIYVGSVGKGFTKAEDWKLGEEMDKLVTSKPSVAYGVAKMLRGSIPR